MKSDLERAALTLIKQSGLPTPETEFRFHPTRKWRFDIAFPEHMVALEIEGGLFVKGRHVQGAAVEKDCEKFSVAAALGWRVLRASNHQVESAAFIPWLRQALERAS